MVIPWGIIQLMVDLVEVDRLVLDQGERVEATLKEASLKVTKRGLNQAGAGRIFSVTMETSGVWRQEHATKEMVTSLFALKVSDWLELIAECKHVQ